MKEWLLRIKHVGPIETIVFGVGVSCLFVSTLFGLLSFFLTVPNTSIGLAAFGLAIAGAACVITAAVLTQFRRNGPLDEDDDSSEIEVVEDQKRMPDDPTLFHSQPKPSHAEAGDPDS